MNISIKNLYYLAYICAFMPMFVLMIVPGTGMFIPYVYIMTFLVYILLYFFYFNKLKVFIRRIFLFGFMKSFLIFHAFVILSAFINILQGHFDFRIVYYYIIRFMNFYGSSFLVFSIPVLGLFFNIKLKKMIKLFYVLIFLTMTIALLQFMSHLLNLTFIDSFLDFFSNARSGLYAYEKTGDSLKDRVYALFSEPSALGMFICMTLPFILKSENYKIFNSVKFSLLKNILNKSFLPIALFVLLTTQSPIFIIIGIIELLILYMINNRHNIKKHITFACMIVSILVLIVYTFDKDIISDNSVVKRIQISATAFQDYDKFILHERSLATRIYSLFHEMAVYKKNKIIGCGFANSAIYANNNLNINDIPIPMSSENYIQYAIHPKLWTANVFIFFTLLAETGLIGTLLYFIFLIKMYNFLKRKIRCYSETYTNFITALKQSLIITIVLSLYTSNIANILLWLVYGYILMIAYYSNYNVYRQKSRLIKNKY